jgi:hypothetical protein
MWMIYLILAVMSPIAVIALKNFLTQQKPEAVAATIEEGSAS